MATVRRYTFNSQTYQLGGQQAVNLNHMQVPFTASVVVDVVSGSARYSVEFTTDSIAHATDPSTVRWNPLPNTAVGMTANSSSNTSLFQYTINFPVTAVRLNLASLTGETRMSVIQGPGSL